LILDLHARGNPAAYISFDRGWLVGGGPWALFDEIVRQAGMQLPEQRDRAKDLRQRANRLSARSAGLSEIASRVSQQRDVVDPSLLMELASLLMDHARFVIVLDTLEEIARRDDSFGYDIFSFIADLSSFVP